MLLSVALRSRWRKICAVGPFAQQGFSAALSADGNTAVVGGPLDNPSPRATWVFTPQRQTWSQQGSKLVGTGAAGRAQQGSSVAISAIGIIALVGGVEDSSFGGAWAFAAPNFNPIATHDFNGDGVSDVLWLDTNHDVGMLMKGATLLQGVVFNSMPPQWSPVEQRDFNGDGFADILWRDTSSNLGIWFMNGITITSTAAVGQLPANWVVVGSDIKGDVFLRNTSSGDVGVWLLSGGHKVQAVDLGQVPLSWTIAGIGDFDGKGSTDILWRNPTGAVAVWLMNGLSVESSTTIGIVDVAANWTVAQTGDYNGDGTSDILWVDTAGDVAIWFLNGPTVASFASLGNVGTIWRIQSLGAD